MKIAIACDHGALALKNKMVEVLTKEGYEVKDFGTDTASSCDYPDYAAPAANSHAMSPAHTSRRLTASHTHAAAEKRA